MPTVCHTLPPGVTQAHQLRSLNVPSCPSLFSLIAHFGFSSPTLECRVTSNLEIVRCWSFRCGPIRYPSLLGCCMGPQLLWLSLTFSTCLVSTAKLGLSPFRGAYQSWLNSVSFIRQVSSGDWVQVYPIVASKFWRLEGNAMQRGDWELLQPIYQ